MKQFLDIYFTKNYFVIRGIIMEHFSLSRKFIGYVLKFI